MQFYNITVKNKQQETADTVTIELDIPESLQPEFVYKHGQYITIRLKNGEQELRRSYSMSSSPLENKVAITVKKVPGGVVSTYLHDQLGIGDTLEIASPEGRFYNKLDPDKRRTYYLFGAGSGITPLMSIIKTTLESEPMSTIFLLYGSRNEEQIIFKEALELLSEQRYAGQLFVEHILSQPKKEGGGLFGLFKKSSSNWNGKSGRIDAKQVDRFLEENMPHGPESDCVYFVCGPGNMAETVETALLNRHIPAAQVHTERFLNAHQVPGAGPAPVADGGARLIVHLKGERIETIVPKGETILDVLVREKHDVPYSCTAGACSTCMAKVMQGKVAMDACYALDDDEVKAGYCLTCQSKPETDFVEIAY